MQERESTTPFARLHPAMTPSWQAVRANLAQANAYSATNVEIEIEGKETNTNAPLLIDVTGVLGSGCWIDLGARRVATGRAQAPARNDRAEAQQRSGRTRRARDRRRHDHDTGRERAGAGKR